MVSHGYVAITPQYRIGKGLGTRPRESVMDAKPCIRWVRSHAIDLGIDPNRLMVGGGSTGGLLAAACASVAKINLRILRRWTATSSVSKDGHKLPARTSMMFGCDKL
ncbi:alpha/beta hydrolase [Tichowtungia aerotolerans]